MPAIAPGPVSLHSLSAQQIRTLSRTLTDDEAAALLYDWHAWARPEQIAPPGDWQAWLLLAGRGFGKSRTGAEWVRGEVEAGRRKRLALIGRTAADVRDVIVEGESGILACSPPWWRPRWEPSKRRLTWPNGATATTYSADKPDALRGPQHDGAWADELASWRYLDEAWSNLLFGLRLGHDPRVVVTTTPRPVSVVRELLKDATAVVTRGSTYDNRANLAKSFIEQIIRRYEGTRLGRQELHAELLDDNPGALWRREWIDAQRTREHPALIRVVVGVDPGVSSEEGAAATGIIVAGIAADGNGYLLDDRTIVGTPREWAAQVIAAYHHHKADRVVAEVNNGGEMVEATLRTIDRTCAYRAVHASRGKAIRAEPVSALYEQGRVHHVGMFAHLEDEYCQWDPTDTKAPSPNRLDAAVWALTELMVKASHSPLRAEDIGAVARHGKDTRYGIATAR